MFRKEQSGSPRVRSDQKLTTEMHCSVIFLALLAAVLLRRNSVHASSNWVASVSTSEWTDVWRSAMSLYSTDNEYHSKSMGSTLNHSARRMQEMSKEQVPCVVCGNRDKVCVAS